jgi:Fur family transcriptional regulator, ferric uptake regulator
VSFPAVAVGQSPESKFREYLASRSRPQRFTGQQRDLVKYIFSSHNHFDAEELLEAVKREKLTVSRATAYRTLTKLVDAGLLRRLDIGARTVYEHDYGYPQHDHLVCEQCGKMIEFQRAELEPLLREVASEHLFQVAGHSLIVRGVCADCNRARGNRRKLDLI